MKNTLILILFLAFPALLWAHGKKHHDVHNPEKALLAQIEPHHTEKTIFSRIQQDYQAQVQSIFTQKCFACHSSESPLPWYAAIPGIKQLIQWDTNEAQTHLELSQGFPFQGHGSPREDLEAILQTLQDRDMPPFRYWIFHPSHSLSPEELKKTRLWAEEGLKLLATKPSNH